MNKYKRIVSAALCACMVSVGVTPTFAAGNENISPALNAQSEVYLTINDDEATILRKYDPDSVKAVKDGSAGAYQIENTNQFVFLTEEGTSEVYDRVQLNTTSTLANTTVFSELNLSDASISSIQNAIESQAGNPEFEVYLYTSSDSVSRASRPFDTDDEIIEYRNMNTGYNDIASGSRTGRVCNTIIDLVITAGGFFTDAFPIVGAGKSLLSIFDVDTVTGSNEDFAQFKLLYDKLEKYTSVYDGSQWIPGCRSYKVWIDEGETYQYYAAEKLEDTYKTYFNEVVYSDSYENADEVALDNFSYSMHIDDPLYFEVGDLVIRF